MKKTTETAKPYRKNNAANNSESRFVLGLAFITLIGLLIIFTLKHFNIIE